MFNAILRRWYFPPERKRAHLVSIVKPRNDPTLPSSYRPISLIDTVGKMFEKILLARVFRKINKHGILRYKQCNFRPSNTTALQLAHLSLRLTDTLTTGYQLARFSSVWLKHSTPYGSVESVQANHPNFPS